MFRALLWTDPLICLVTAFMASLSLVASIFDGTGRAQHRIARRWARMVMAVSGVKVTVSGLENLTAGATYVFCSNHLSLIDTPLVFGYIPWDFRILAKEYVFRIPFLGWHMRRAGHFPVKEDLRSSVRNLTGAARRVAEGVPLVIFPEGGRSPDGQMREFKPGVAYIAIKAGVPIVPMGIIGTREIHRTGTLVVRPGPVELRFGAPIVTSQMTVRDADRLLAELRQRIAEIGRASGSGRAERDVPTLGRR